MTSFIILLSQSAEIGKNIDGSISYFRISGQSFTNNSRTNHDIEMKLGPVTKLDKRNTETLKRFDYDVMSANCDVIVFFFRFMVNLQPSGSRISKAWSVKLTF